MTQKQWRAILGTDPSSFQNCDDCPVESVSWEDVQVFITRLNEKSGRQYRLPTEAEWEYAAKGGQNYQYAGSDNIENVAWYENNSGYKTHPVGQKAGNGYGLYDMLGNVWEWCSDWQSTYSSFSATNPTGPITGSFRVFRGGSWYDFPERCRVVFRNSDTPNFSALNLGFRLVSTDN